MANSNPVLTLPQSEQVAAGGSIDVSGISYSDSAAAANAGAMYLSISDASGLLYADDGAGAVSGSGSNTLTLSGSYAEITAALQSLSYDASGTAASDTISFDLWNQYGTETTGSIPVTIGASGSGPTLTEPASETVAAGGTVAITGSYYDSYAPTNPGQMYVEAIATVGTVYATDAAGNPAPGSGTNAIRWYTDYNDINAVLSSLTYQAGDGAGTDSIHMEVWNQAGVMSADNIPVTITAGSDGATVSWTGAADDGAWNTAANWSGNAVPESGDTVVIAPGGATGPSLANAILAGETIMLESSASTGPSVIFNDVTLGAGTVLESAGSGGSIGDIGTLTVASGATIAAGGAALNLSGDGSGTATLINNGTIINTGSAIAGLDAVVENHGVIIDNGPGNLSIGDGGSIINTGTIVDAGATVALNGAVLGGTVAFAAPGGSLLLGVLNPFAQGAIVSGFGAGDSMVLGAFSPAAMSFSGGTLDLSGGSFGETIPFAGTPGLGNFELNDTQAGANGATTATLLYAPSGGPAGTASGEPDITAPGTATVAQGGTLALNTVSIGNAATVTLNITSDSGTLDMAGASGNGTNHLTLTGVAASQANTDLASLTYAPSAGVTSDTIEISASAPFSVTGTTDTIRYVPVSITGGGGGSGPALSEPANETVTAGGTVAVAGSYSDSFAAGNPGAMYLGISDSSGTLSATNASGQAVAGSGSNSIALSTDYVDANAILASLHYTAGANAGSDSIVFDLWNQAGVETTGSTAITVDPATGAASQSAMAMLDFPAGGSMASSVPAEPGSSTGSMAGTPADTQPVVTMPPIHS